MGQYLKGRYAFTPLRPDAPSNLIAQAISSNQVSLAWKAADIRGPFALERKAGSNGTYAVVGQVANGLSYLDSALSAGTQYFYRVRVPNYFGDSDYSNETNATPVAGQMSVPLSDANLVLWLEAGVGHRSVGAVDSWQNRANTAQYATQGTVSYQPQFVTNGLNGLPVMRFDGATRKAKVTKSRPRPLTCLQP